MQSVKNVFLVVPHYVVAADISGAVYLRALELILYLKDQRTQMIQA